jgi:uncharacterized protein (DUF433 family)
MRERDTELFTPAEAAVLSRRTAKAVNNAIDKRTVEPHSTSGGGQRVRLLDRSAIVYLWLEGRLARDTTPEFRRRLFAAIASAPARRIISIGALRLDLSEPRREVDQRLKDLRQAKRIVVSDPEVLGGTPVFRRTRIPVHHIADLLRQGDTPEALQKSYPRLTDEMIRLAPIYAAAHPARGRPRKQPWHDGEPLAETRVRVADLAKP